jgi:hypothetical protein
MHAFLVAIKVGKEAKLDPSFSITLGHDAIGLISYSFQIRVNLYILMHKPVG